MQDLSERSKPAANAGSVGAPQVFAAMDVQPFLSAQASWHWKPAAVFAIISAEKLLQINGYGSDIRLAENVPPAHLLTYMREIWCGKHFISVSLSGSTAKQM